MADWFKFYENDLDETRLQYAISKLPEVVSVWVGLLSECCRHKSNCISWGADEIELFGFSRRLNISIPKVNEAINLLLEIRYISSTDSHIAVIKWDKKQSEYCQKLTKHQNQAGDQNPNRKKTPDSVPTVSRHTPDSVGQEERRGEEKRTEEREERGSSPAPESYAEIPSWDEFWDYCQGPQCNLTAEWFARDKFLAAESANWERNQNWRAYARRCQKWWESDGRPSEPPQKKGQQQTKPKAKFLL